MSTKILCKALQWKYTACRYNIENANGFHTFSMSEGLTPKDKDELIYYAGNYIKPDSCSDRPAPEEIACFPVNYSSFRLSSGRRVLVQTRYVGQDYAGVRWGNFFSHALILTSDQENDATLFWPFHPIQLWGSHIFADGLTREEQNLGETPDFLPIVEIMENDLIDWNDKLSDFFSASSDAATRQLLFKNIMDTLRTNRKNSKPVLLLDNPEHIPLWFAAIQYSLPTRCSQEINFSTYLYSKGIARNYDLIGTIKDETEISQHTQENINNFSRVDVINNDNDYNKIHSKYTDIIQFDPNLPGNTLNTFIEDCEHNLWNCDIFDFGKDSPETVFLFNKFLKDGKAITQPVLDYYISLSFEKKQTALRIALNNIKRFDYHLKDGTHFIDNLKVMFFMDLEKVALRSNNNQLQKDFVNFCYNQFLSDLYHHCIEKPLDSVGNPPSSRNNYPLNFNSAKIREFFLFLEVFFEKSEKGENHLAKSLKQILDIGIKDQSKKQFDRTDCLVCILYILITYITEADNTELLLSFNEHHLASIPPVAASIIYNAVYRVVIEKAKKGVDFEILIDAVFKSTMKDESKHFILRNLIQCLSSDYLCCNWVKKQSLPKKQGIIFMEYILKLKEKDNNSGYYAERFNEIKRYLPFLLFERVCTEKEAEESMNVAYRNICKQFPLYKQTIAELFDHQSFFRRHLKFFLGSIISALSVIALSLICIIIYVIIHNK